MGTLFDQYRDNYETEINQAISFSGRNVDFYTQAKAEIFAELMARSFPDTDSLRVLDIGCGPASIHPMIASSLGRLTGVDVAESQLVRAMTANPDNGYAAYDGARLPFADNTFDVTFTICVMHHVPPSQWPDFVGEMFRVTTPGGMVVIFEHNPYNVLTRIVVNRCEFDKDAVLLASSRVMGLLAEAGFVDAFKGFFLVSPFKAKLFRMLDRGLRRLPLGAQYYVAARTT